MVSSSSLWASLGLLSSALALSISEINGPAFLSPYKDQSVANVSGLVTAVSSAGFYLRDPVKNKKSPGSPAIYVFGSAAAKTVAVGDIVTLSGKVEEYRNNNDHIPLTEITGPTDVVKVSSGNPVEAVDLGKLKPPTEQYSALDENDVFGLPNARARVSEVNATLEPKKYGLDFWESLVGELVTVKDPVALGASSNYGDVWIRSAGWKVTGLNKRGGLTISASANNKKTDANPEAIIVGSPLDSSKNPMTIKIGDKLGPITGVVTYAFGFYRILPVTALTVSESAPSEYPPTNLKSSGSCSGLTVGQYNVENLNPKSAHLPALAAQIVSHLKSPDLLFLQEVQDNDGATNSGQVSANETLSALVSAIAAAGGVSYTYTDIAPSNNQDGGAPGSNIRVAYLFNPAVLSLRDANPGDALTPATITADAATRQPVLSPNPARIAPASEAWTASRKPLVAAFTVKGTNKPLFAINVHFGSKGGSSSIHGDPRPPVNGGVEDRLAQATLVKEFIDRIVAVDEDAHIISAGDFNEFSFVEPMEIITGGKGKAVMKEVDEIVRIPEEERYSYSFDGNCQQLDHMFVSRGVWKNRKGGVREYEHLHVNTWAGRAQVSDHDPAVGVVGIC